MGSRTRKGRAQLEEDRWAAMTERLAALEDRVRILEARVRDMSVQARKEAAAAAASGKKPPRAARERPRPRCPGCTLELPKGRRGDYCVWCGFMFSAVGGRALR